MTSFLREPATKRDLLTGSAVLALMLVLVVLAATVAAIRLHKQYDLVIDENRILIERVDDQAIQLEAQQTDLVEADEQLESVPAQIRREVRVIVNRITQPQRAPASTSEPEVRTIRIPGTDRTVTVPVVGRELPSLPLRPVRAPVQRPDRPRLVPGLPDLPRRPERPQRPVVQPPVVAPPVVTPAPTPPPTIAPPVVAPPRPGNKPPHAPCPPSNKHCQ